MRRHQLISLLVLCAFLIPATQTGVVGAARPMQESTLYTWWLARWNDNALQCTIFITHEGTPTANEVEAQCGLKLRLVWEATPPCKDNDKECKGLYLSLVSSQNLATATATSTSSPMPGTNLPPAGSATPILSTPAFTNPPDEQVYWLSHPNSVDGLLSNYPLTLLAGKLISNRIVLAGKCPNGGLLANGAANACGLEQARYEIYQWQNRFNQQIFDAYKDTKIPPYLLKGVFIMETQMWPATSRNKAWDFGEYGLGQMNQLGADTLLAWNGSFYKNLCSSAFNEKTCEKDYISLPEDQRAILRGATINLVSADCPTCTYGIDITKAESSVPFFAQTLLANYAQVQQVVRNATGWYFTVGITSEDMWRFTLVNYHAGPGCLYSALGSTHMAGSKLTWRNVSKHLEPGCQSAIDYVNAINTVYVASPLPAPTATSFPTNTPTLIPTITLTETATPTITATLVPSETVAPTETSIAATETVAPTETSIATTETVTPIETSVATTETVAPIETSVPTIETVTPTETSIATTETVTPTGTSIPTTETLIPTDAVTPTSTPVITATPTDDVISGAIVVKFNNQVPDPIAESAIESAGGEMEGQVDDLGITIVSAPEGQTDEVISNLEDSPLVEYVEPNYVRHTSLIPTDSGYSTFPEQLAYLNAMQIPDAWDLTGYYGSVRGQNIIIAVIDTGVDVTHPEFGFDPTFDSSTTPYTTPFTNSVNTSANIWLNYYGSNASCWSGGSGESDFYDWDWCINGDWVYQSSDGVDNELNGYVDDWMGWNFVGNTNNVTDDSLNGHGTSVAGIIAAKLNDFQISGAAPQAKIMALKALDSNGNGSSTNIAAAIIYAANKGARVINLSFGGPGYSQTEKDAIDYAISKGAVVIASAGNSGDATPHYPAAYDGVIGVSALDGTLTNLASFSSFGSQVDLAAPGEGVYAPIPGGGYTFQSGSSMSAAYVSGIAALLASYGYYGPEICVPDPDFGDYCYTPVVWPFNTPAAIRTALLNTALDLGTAGYDTQFGNGRVQALNALNSALSADLSLTKSIDNATPYVGGNVNFTLTVTNGGLNSATGVTVKDLLPAPDLTYVSYSGDGTYDSSTGIWTVGSVANGASKSLTITASVVSANIITNVAEIWTSDQSDPDSTPANSASAEDDYATTAATPRVLTADLSLSKTVSNKRPVIGDTVVFEVYAANNTPSDPYVPPDPASNATGVTIKDLLPAGLNYVSHSVTGGTYDSTTGIWDIGTLPSHQGWFLRITAEVTGSGIITNSAEIWTSDLFDPDSTPGNGIATEDDSASVSLRVADPGLTEVFWAQSQTCSGTLTNGNNSIITPYAFDNAVSKCDQPPSTTGVTITNFQRPTGIDTTSFASIYSATLDLHFYVTDWIRIPYTGYGNTYHVEFSPDNGANWYLIGIIPPDYQWPPATLTHFRYNVSDFETIVIRSTINNVVNTPDEVRDFQVRIIKWNDGPEVPAIYIDQASLTVVGNTPPTINITSPGGAYQQGTPITFAAISNDTEDGALAGNIQDIKWKVDNVYIGSGRGFVKADLTPDVHVITATVTDSSGLSSSDTVTISVNPNTAPVVTITAPTVYTFSKGEIVIFKGTGTDIQDGDLTAHLSWYSDIDGLLGNSGIVSVNHLTPGTHTVTAQVTDSNGITGISAPITITITNLSGPHGNFSALTDACAKCHRTHTAPAAGLLLSPESAKTSNTFCLSCHNGTIASAVSTHSNINARMPIESPGFELLCVQCHDAHGTTNLFAVRKEAFTTLNPDTTNGPVTFTSLLGSNSFDDGGLGGSAEANRICVTCHIATSVTMINGHVGGAGHNGNGVTAYNYTEKSCISCHPHDADGVPSTRDGFTVVAGTCDGCHGAPPATGAHLAHSDPATVPTVYGETGAKNSAAAYNFGCGECHPTDVSNHLDGTVEVNLAQETAPTTSLKAKNGRAANSKPATYTSGSCSNVYCHSGNGITSTDPGYPTGGLDEFGNQTYAPYNVATFRTYKTTPAWSNGPTGWAGYDECTGCHAFPPTTYDPSVTKYAGILAYPPFEGASPSYAGVGDSHRALVIDDSAYSSPDSVVDILHSNNMRPYTSEPSIPCRICHFGEITADNGNYVFTANDPSGYTLAINVYNPVPVANRANHVNGYANVNINNAATIVYGGGPPYGQSLSLAFATYNSARQTCSNAGCHYYQPENWWESPRFGQYAPVWGSPYHGSFNAGSIECSACHQW